MPGPDHSSSFDPAGFARLVQGIRDAEKALGSARKTPAEVERRNAQGMRRSIVAKQKINAGQVITEDMLTFKRPANGLRPSFFFDVVGRVARRDIAPDQLLAWDVLKERE